MATMAARSPSPGPARPCSAMRRSAGSSPFKPADCPHTSSSVSKNGCHASPRKSFGEKENEQGDAARTPKARSGGAKNFMAPTFSAASKAVAASASPRKKVLGERNEQHHLAPSSSGDLAQKPKGPPEAGATRRLRLSFDGAAPAPLAAAPEVSHTSRHSFGGEDARMENPVCKNHRHMAGVAADSVDAEPSHAAPYDPKTNYLSPRPRFLRYKPNPRIEMYRHGVRRLEEGFASESSEETDTTTMEDDELTEEEQEQAQQKPEPNDLPEEPSALAEALVLPPEPVSGSPRALVLTSEPAASSPRAHVLTPEPRATSPRARAQTPEPEPRATSPRACAQTPEPELGGSIARVRAKKRSSLRFLLAAPLALILFMAAAFVCVPPPPDSPLMSKVSDFLSVQELQPVELAAWLKQWSSSSLDSITSYWEALASAQEQEFFGPPFAANLSAAAVDADLGADFYYNFAETWSMTSEEPIGDRPFEEELKIQDVVSASELKVGDVVVEEESTDVAVVEEEPIGDTGLEQEALHAKTSPIEEANETGDSLVVEELDAEMSEEVLDSNGEEMASFSQNLDIPSETTGEPEQRDNLEEQDVEIDESEGDHANGKVDQEVYRDLHSDSSMWPGYLDKISKSAAVGVALVVVILSTGMAVLYMRQKQVQVAANANAPAEQVEQTETQSGSGSSEGHLLVKSSQFQSSMAEETERFVGSEVSQDSSSHGRRKTKEEESPSLEPMSKRESTAYSTSSYGSFTTYEKISAKKRNKEDEAMTPVRRSSRLRNVKSPEV